MTGGQRLGLVLAAAAALLLAGRGVALAFSEFSWYDALGAAGVWREKMSSAALLHLLSALFAAAFAFANLAAVRRSIVSLALPRRIGNVEIGEAVPARYLTRAAGLGAVFLAAIMALFVPDWRTVALAGAGVRFGTTDPYFHLDLGFYTGWLPFESAWYVWCLALVVLVSAIVALLYSLTPGLRWQRSAFRVSVHVRRHLAVLCALLLLCMAWSFRLDAYRLLITGTGPGGMFTSLDHQWLIPSYLSLSVGTVAAAALVLVSGWAGQLRTSFIAVTAVLVFSISLDLILPAIARSSARENDSVVRQSAYAATRAAFTRLAYGFPRNAQSVVPVEERRFVHAADSTRIAQLVRARSGRMVVYPGARGALLVHDPASDVAAPEIGGGITRLAHAWAERRADVLSSDVPPHARLVRVRNARDRVTALFPMNEQGAHFAALFRGDTLVWVVEMYSSSRWFPLSEHFNVAGDSRTYFRHAGTAIVNSLTGEVRMLPRTPLDPFTSAWRTKFPQLFHRTPSTLLDELRTAPSGTASPAGAVGRDDATFRREVSRLYGRMRDALAAGDLRGFAAAYDSLGALVQP